MNYTTIFNFDNNNKTRFLSSNMKTDIEDWINDAENSALNEIRNEKWNWKMLYVFIII